MGETWDDVCDGEGFATSTFTGESHFSAHHCAIIKKTRATKTSSEHILFHDKEILIIQHTIVPLSRQDQEEEVRSIYCLVTRRESLISTPLCHYQDKSNKTSLEHM